jgi:hypothetical protein
VVAKFGVLAPQPLKLVNIIVMSNRHKPKRMIFFIVAFSFLLRDILTIGVVTSIDGDYIACTKVNADFVVFVALKIGVAL